jgi:hypothetical protein
MYFARHDPPVIMQSLTRSAVIMQSITNSAAIDRESGFAP